MIFLSNLIKVTETKYSIGYIHYMPFDKANGLGKTQQELESEGILIESIEEPLPQENKNSILYINPKTKELWYEYVDIPKTQEQIQQEKVSELESQIETQNQAIAELTMMIATPTA